MMVVAMVVEVVVSWGCACGRGGSVDSVENIFAWSVGVGCGCCMGLRAWSVHRGGASSSRRRR